MTTTAPALRLAFYRLDLRLGLAWARVRRRYAHWRYWESGEGWRRRRERAELEHILERFGTDDTRRELHRALLASRPHGWFDMGGDYRMEER